jgi:hypothetical protein
MLGEYIYKGRKFNARKETTEEKYLSITIYRFYIRCTVCPLMLFLRLFYCATQLLTDHIAEMFGRNHLQNRPQKHGLRLRARRKTKL